MQRYEQVKIGDTIYITRKLHGTSARTMKTVKVTKVDTTSHDITTAALKANYSDYKIVEAINLFNFIRTLTLIHRNVKDFIAPKCIL